MNNGFGCYLTLKLLNTAVMWDLRLNARPSCICQDPLPQSCYMPMSYIAKLYVRQIWLASLFLPTLKVSNKCLMHGNVLIWSEWTLCRCPHSGVHIYVASRNDGHWMFECIVKSAHIWARRFTALSSVHHVSSQMRSRIQSGSLKQWSLIWMVELKMRMLCRF